MNINDYLIDPSGHDWSKLLSFWIPPLPPQFSLWLINRLGDVFVVTADQKIGRLDIGSGVFAEVAESREHFAQLLNRHENAELWLRVSLVNACMQSGMKLNARQCYGFRLPPTLGGKYELANLTPTELAVHYSYQAYICKQSDIYWIPPR
jgi:hypothetical protein